MRASCIWFYEKELAGPASVRVLGPKKGETNAILVFNKTLIVTANGDEEEQTVNILKAMDPLLALRALSSNVEHAVS
jgi:hypothetical protein